MSYRFSPDLVTEKKDFPQYEEHLAVLIFDTYTIDDGCGNFSSEPMIRYMAFEEEKDLTSWILNNQSKKFQIIKVKPVTYTMTAKLDLE